MPALAGPGQPPERAPLLIGRLQWELPAETIGSGSTIEWIWGLGVLAVIAVALGVRAVYDRSKGRKPAAPPTISGPQTGEVMPIDEWLDRADFGDDDRADH